MAGEEWSAARTEIHLTRSAITGPSVRAQPQLPGLAPAAQSAAQTLEAGDLQFGVGARVSGGVGHLQLQQVVGDGLQAERTRGAPGARAKNRKPPQELFAYIGCPHSSQVNGAGGRAFQTASQLPGPHHQPRRPHRPRRRLRIRAERGSLSFAACVPLVGLLYCGSGVEVRVRVSSQVAVGRIVFAATAAVHRSSAVSSSARSAPQTHRPPSCARSSTATA